MYTGLDAINGTYFLPLTRNCANDPPTFDMPGSSGILLANFTRVLLNADGTVFSTNPTAGRLSWTKVANTQVGILVLTVTVGDSAEYTDQQLGITSRANLCNGDPVPNDAEHTYQVTNTPPGPTGQCGDPVTSTIGFGKVSIVKGEI